MNAIVEPIHRPLLPSSTTRACPICGADRPRPLYENRMAPIDEFDFSYAVVACGCCPMVYADRALAPDMMARYYRELSKYDGGAADSSGDIHRARFAAAFVRRFAGPGASVLDVGCSTGLFLAELAKTGSQHLAGIEPSVSAVATARSRRGLEVTVGDASTCTDFARFDVVTLLAVLEHLREPAGVVERIAAALRPGALLVIEVPDAGAFGRQEALGVATEPFGEFSVEHVNFFGDAALRYVARDCGLTAVGRETLLCESKQSALFVAFCKGPALEVSVDPEDAYESVAEYVTRSRSAMEDVDRQFATMQVSSRIVVYGAGSHTARLLRRAALRPFNVVAILDRNPNLIGRRMHNARIAEPSYIASHPGLPVVVSTFNAQTAVSEYVASYGTNPVVSLYAPA